MLFRSPPVKGVEVDDSKELTRDSSDSEPFSALAFKIMTDPFVGTITYIRVYSGVLNSGTSVFNPLKNSSERIGRLLKMHAEDREEIQVASAGDIVAVVGLKEISTAHTLSDVSNRILLESMSFPDPVLSVAIEAKVKQIRIKWILL